MLSPDYLQKITELTEQKVSEVNEYLTAKIIKRIIKLFEETGEVKIIPSSLLDLKKQQYAGRLLDEIQIEVEQQLPEIRNEIRKAFYDAGAKIANDINATTGEILQTVQRNGDLTDVSMPEFENKQKASKLSDLNMSEKEISCLESAYRRTQGELYNLTKTSANSAQQTFIKACDEAYFKATHGTSLDTAIVEAIREVSKKGITTVHYASGHEDKIEVAIARAVRTGINQANGDITLTRCAEAGVNYVVTSSHIGARVTPYADYRTHAEWQGQVYSLDWSRSELSPYEPQPHEVPKGRFSFLNNMKEFFQDQKNKKYKDFIETCGYGKMLGICGINCRHSFGLFYPGISINNQNQYDSEENKKRYQQEQKQREMERAIRQTKRELNGLNSAGLDSEDAKLRKRELRELLQVQDTAYQSYCRKYGLKPLNYRLQVAKSIGISNDGVVPQRKVNELHTVRTIEEIQTRAEEIYQKLDRVIERKGVWNGKVVLVESGTPNRVLRNFSIGILSDASDVSIMHELIHTKSYGPLGYEAFKKYRPMEEASVELLAREMGLKEGYTVADAQLDVQALLKVNEYVKLYETNYEFAVKLLNVDLPDRAAWLIRTIFASGLSDDCMDELLELLQKDYSGTGGSLID